MLAQRKQFFEKHRCTDWIVFHCKCLSEPYLSRLYLSSSSHCIWLHVTLKLRSYMTLRREMEAPATSRPIGSLPPPAPGYQQNSEKRWPYKIFTIILWAVQSHQKYMGIVSKWFFCIFCSKIFKKFLNSATASSLIQTWCNCKELRTQGQIGGIKWKVRTILPF